jgi:EAL domain-containing protein (putative c-di-GMP-specific phosphodiesterase class I)
MGEACRQAGEWRDAGLPEIVMSVNVSAVEFSDKLFLQGINKLLSDTRIEAGQLNLEVTEGVLMKDVGATAAVLRELKRIGVKLTVDDFGTGYSSLSYLRQFPIDGLKIDRSFVQQITDSSGDNGIVSAIIAMGESLGYLVVAEGIETGVQEQYLKSRGCAQGQGYLFSRPVPATQIALLLQAGLRSSVPF